MGLTSVSPTLITSSEGSFSPFNDEPASPVSPRQLDLFNQQFGWKQWCPHRRCWWSIGNLITPHIRLDSATIWHFQVFLVRFFFDGLNSFFFLPTKNKRFSLCYCSRRIQTHTDTEGWKWHVRHFFFLTIIFFCSVFFFFSSLFFKRWV